jgi:hypothetical protein
MHPIIPSKLYMQAGQIVTSSSGVRVAVIRSDGLIALPSPTVLFTIGAAVRDRLDWQRMEVPQVRLGEGARVPAKALPAGVSTLRSCTMSGGAPVRQAGGNYRVTNGCSRCTLPP